MYARHVEDPEFIGGREPFGSEHFGLELNAERLKAEGLMGCPFGPAQGKGSPLYACPVATVLRSAVCISLSHPGGSPRDHTFGENSVSG